MYERPQQPIPNPRAANAQSEQHAFSPLVARQAAERSQLVRALADANREARPRILRAIADHLGCDMATRLPETIPGEILGCVGGATAWAHGVIPLAGDLSSLTLAAIDPLASGLIADLAFALRREIRLVVAEPAEVQRLLRNHYREDSSGTPPPAMDSRTPSAGIAIAEPDLEQLAGDTATIRLVNDLLTEAVKRRAADIHFEPFERDFKIRCRVDGALQEIASPARHLALSVISRVKVLANLNIAERRLPQDGRIRLDVDGRAVDVRVSTLPTQFGESVVLRILDQTSVHLALDQLGLPASIKAGLGAAIRRPNGIVVVTGPTGSGKTTTLYSCLAALNATEAKLLTVEDPVEYEIPGIMQVAVNPGAGLTFPRALRTFLRQDPDVVMVGEIRDVETAEVSIQAALTGHLVLTTLHTNDAPSAVTRLVDMGIERFLLASTLEAVLAQRLVRRLCPICRVSYEPTASVRHQLGWPEGLKGGPPLHAARGCAACGHTGYQGRLGLFEFLPMSDQLREHIMSGVSLMEFRRHAITQGMTTLRHAGLAALAAGETTLEEVLRVT